MRGMRKGPSASRCMDQELRRTSMVVTTPVPIKRARTVTDSRGMRGMPPVSGSTLIADDAAPPALLVALALEVGLAEAEAPLIALVEAEALEAGLGATLSSTPRSSIPRSSIPLSSKPRSSAPSACIPLSSKPRSSAPWAAATGAKTNTANATDKTSNMDLRIVSPRSRLHILGKDARPGAV